MQAAPSSFIHPGNQGKRGAWPHVERAQLWSQTGLGLAPVPSQTSRMTLGSSPPLDLGFFICKMGTIPTFGVTQSSNYTAWSTIHA